MSEPDQSDRPDGEQARSGSGAVEQPTATGATAASERSEAGSTTAGSTAAGTTTDGTTTDPAHDGATTTDATTTDAGTTGAAEDGAATTGRATTAAASTPGEDATAAHDVEAADAREAAGPTTATGRSDDDLSDEEVDRILGEDDEEEHRSNLRPALLGVVGGVVLSAIVVGILMLTLGSGFLLGPGSPDDTANEAVGALAAKDPARLAAVTCTGQDGAPVQELSPQIVQAIESVNATGPLAQVLDTVAQQPITVTLSAQGQTQSLPAALVLGVTDGSWCFNGLAQTEQQ